MSKEITVSWNCCLCGTETELRINAPANWGHINGIDVEDSLCDRHAGIEKFISEQCPGCVGGWSDCDLWRSFAYNKVTVTDIDLTTIEQGVCPKRTGGTFTIEDGEMKDLDLSSIASNESGEDLAAAIREYIACYHTEEVKP